VTGSDEGQLFDYCAWAGAVNTLNTILENWSDFDAERNKRVIEVLLAQALIEMVASQPLKGIG
jgi:hypothetical protein